MFEAVAPTDGRTPTPVLGATTTPFVLDLIERFRAAGPTMRVCPHLVEDSDQGAVWRPTIPDLCSCRRASCTAAVDAHLEERLGHPLEDEPTRCTTCGRVGVAVRGVGVAVGPTMLRGTVCDDCLNAKPVPTPSSVTDPLAAPAAGDARRSMELVDEPLPAEPEALDAAAADEIPFDRIGLRALRRGALMADACCRSTTSSLDAEQAVVGGLMVRAAKLAGGLEAVTPKEWSLVHDLAFRSLVATTTILREVLRGEGTGDPPADAAGAPGRTADPSTWRELADRHLSDGPDGPALDLSPDAVDPLETLVAGERLSLACADYVDRMPTDLDPDHVRPLAEEVTTLRAAVEAAAAKRDRTVDPGDAPPG